MENIYHLEITARYCSVLGLINKFPIYELNGENPTTFSKPINSVLIGEKNGVELIITPSDLMHPEKGDFGISGAVKKYGKEDFTGPDQGEIIHEFKYEKMPLAAFSFRNDFFNFNKLLNESPKIDNKEILINYGMKIRDLIAERKAEDLLNEFRFKLNDYALCYHISPDDLYEQFLFYLEDRVFPNNPRVDFIKEELNIVSWCEDRIFEIGVGLSKEELILTEANEEGMEYATRVYVGLVNGVPKVVR